MPNSQLPTPKKTGTIWELGVVELDLTGFFHRLFRSALVLYARLLSSEHLTINVRM
jgi:hypothetical protein